MEENSSYQMGRFCRQWPLKIRICCHDSEYLSDSGISFRMAIWFDIQGCAFWSHKDSEWAVILLIQLSLFEWQYGLTYKGTPCRSNRIAILKDIGVVVVIGHCCH